MSLHDSKKDPETGAILLSYSLLSLHGLDQIQSKNHELRRRNKSWQLETHEKKHLRTQAKMMCNIYFQEWVMKYSKLGYIVAWMMKQVATWWFKQKSLEGQAAANSWNMKIHCIWWYSPPSPWPCVPNHPCLPIPKVSIFSTTHLQRKLAILATIT